MDCIFCKIIKKEIPAEKIYEEKNVLAFLDIKPINTGHILVIPKKHFKNIYEIPDKDFCDLTKVVKKLSSIIKKATKADGINIGINNDEAAGQVIFHSHIHIIPRFKNDGLKHWKGKERYEKGEMEKVLKKIKKALTL